MEPDEDDDAGDRPEPETKKGNRIRPRERYRVLIDILDEEQSLIAIGDRKARFALMILAAFNAAIIIGGSMAYKAVADLPTFVQIGCAAGILAYGLTAVYFFILAIDALRPRKAVVASRDLMGHGKNASGSRFFRDIANHRKDEYWDRIRDLDYDHLNREMAFQIHALSGLISAKYDTLEHLYSGMRMLTVGAAGLFLAAAGAATAMFLF